MRMKIACKADVSYSFPGGEIEQVSEQAGERRSMPVVRKKQGEVGRGWARRGRGGKKRNRSLASLPLLAPYFLLSVAVLFPLHAFLETPAMQARMKTAIFIKALND